MSNFERTVVVENILVLRYALEGNGIWDVDDILPFQMFGQHANTINEQSVAGDVQRRVAVLVAQVDRRAVRDESANVFELVADDGEVQRCLRVFVADVEPLVVFEAGQDVIEQLLVFSVHCEMQQPKNTNKIYVRLLTINQTALRLFYIHTF